MKSNWENQLNDWMDAGLLDSATAERIRAFEEARSGEGKLRWPVYLAISLGGLLVGAGILLFVAAHWDELSPNSRFALVLAMVAIFHGAGALLVERFGALATVLHGVGTAALGAGIFLTAQIFNLQEHWPTGLLVWAAGAWIGWVLRRDWVQATFAALLTPAWLVGEWTLATQGYRNTALVPAEGALLLALTYLTAKVSIREDWVRRALVVVGGVALLPAALMVVFAYELVYYQHNAPTAVVVLGWIVGLGGPLLVAFWLRGFDVWVNILAAGWVVVLGSLAVRRNDVGRSLAVWAWYDLGRYFWCALGSLGLVAWGLYESRRERINLGMVGFGLTVIFFYFADVMDKLGRSVSLVGLGLIFLVGGWALEKMRRRLVARVANK